MSLRPELTRPAGRVVLVAALLATTLGAAPAALAGSTSATPLATPSATARTTTATSGATTWEVTGLERSAQGLVLTARATRHGRFAMTTGWWTQVKDLGWCTAVQVLDPATARVGLTAAGPQDDRCAVTTTQDGLGDGDSATVTATLADPGGQRLVVVVDDEVVATDVPVTGTATSSTAIGAAAGVLTLQARQTVLQPRFLTSGAAVSGQVVDLSTDVLFAFDSDVLGPDAGAAIDVTAQQLQAQSSRTVTITGHTDAQGDDTYNLGLSQRRAEAVRAALASKLGAGWTLNATGVGESDPIADESRPKDLSGADADAAVTEAQRLNRRVAVVPG